ncbi:HdeD family acid-resistance protein [Sulfurimonas sp.]
MWKYPIEEDLFDKFSKYSKIAGAIFIVLGTIGIIYPVFMTLATVTFVSWIMMFAGFMAGSFTYMSDKNDYLGWLKSFILIGVGAFMLFYPVSGAGTVGLLLSVYFFMDAFASFSLALSMKPSHGWIWWMINAIFSMLIGILFLVDWPFSSMYLIGLLVGFSLFFDGFSLLVTGSIFKKMNK